MPFMICEEIKYEVRVTVCQKNPQRILRLTLVTFPGSVAFFLALAVPGLVGPASVDVPFFRVIFTKFTKPEKQCTIHIVPEPHYFYFTFFPL
jgi:hypothetical protein